MTDDTITIPRPVDHAPADAASATGPTDDAAQRSAQQAMAAAQALRDRVARVLGSVQIRDAQNQGGQ